MVWFSNIFRFRNICKVYISEAHLLSPCKVASNKIAGLYSDFFQTHIGCTPARSCMHAVGGTLDYRNLLSLGVLLTELVFSDRKGNIIIILLKNMDAFRSQACSQVSKLYGVFSFLKKVLKSAYDVTLI